MGFRWTILILGVVLLTAACQTDQQQPQDMDDAGSTAVLEQKHVVPVFSGTDQAGMEFTSVVLKGKPWIGSFFFTTCTTVCPALNAVQSELQRAYGSKVSFVSISTDPDNDTTEALAAYAASFGAQPGAWWMIRMPSDSMRAIATKGFMLMDPEQPDMHSTRLVAVDADMTVVGYFDSTDSTHLTELRTWINSLPSTPH